MKTQQVIRSLLLITLYACGSQSETATSPNEMEEEELESTEEYITEFEGGTETIEATESMEYTESYEHFENAFMDEGALLNMQEELAFDSKLYDEYEPLAEDGAFLLTIETLEEDDYIKKRAAVVNSIRTYIDNDVSKFKRFYNEVDRNFRGNATMKSKDFKLFNGFMLELLGVMHTSSYYYAKEMKQHYTDIKDTVTLKKLQNEHEQFAYQFNRFIEVTTETMKISFGNRRRVNGKILERLFNKSLDAYIELMKLTGDNWVASNIVKPRVLKASFMWQEENSPTNKELLEEQKLGLDIGKVKLDIASGLFGLVNTIVQIFSKKWEQKINRLVLDYKALTIEDWKYI